MYWNKYGLLNAKEGDGVSENTLLFSTEYLLLSNDSELADKMIDFIENNRVAPGLFNQHPEVSGHDKYTSHDSLTGLVAFSHNYGLSYHKEIWDYLKKHWFTYDNVSGETNFDRLMHPRDIIYYGYCAGNWICRLLYPLLVVFMMVSCIQKYKIRGGQKILKTDGKLLSWVRCKGSGLNNTFKLLTLCLKWFSPLKNWSNVFKYYFQEENHPIQRILSGYQV